MRDRHAGTWPVGVGAGRQPLHGIGDTMDRLDSAQNTPQDAEDIAERILEDSDPASDQGAEAANDLLPPVIRDRMDDAEGSHDL